MAIKVTDLQPANLGSTPTGTHRVTDGAERASGQKMFPCTSKSPINLGRHVRDFKQGSQRR